MADGEKKQKKWKSVMGQILLPSWRPGKKKKDGGDGVQGHGIFGTRNDNVRSDSSVPGFWNGPNTDGDSRKDSVRSIASDPPRGRDTTSVSLVGGSAGAIRGGIEGKIGKFNESIGTKQRGPLLKPGQVTGVGPVNRIALPPLQVRNVPTFGESVFSARGGNSSSRQSQRPSLHTPGAQSWMRHPAGSLRSLQGSARGGEIMIDSSAYPHVEVWGPHSMQVGPNTAMVAFSSPKDVNTGWHLLWQDNDLIYNVDHNLGAFYTHGQSLARVMGGTVSPFDVYLDNSVSPPTFHCILEDVGVGGIVHGTDIQFAACVFRLCYAANSLHYETVSIPIHSGIGVQGFVLGIVYFIYYLLTRERVVFAMHSHQDGNRHLKRICVVPVGVDENVLRVHIANDIAKYMEEMHVPQSGYELFTRLFGIQSTSHHGEGVEMGYHPFAVNGSALPGSFCSWGGGISSPRGPAVRRGSGSVGGHSRAAGVFGGGT
eukprot:3778378-Rhodomonas_salina.1